MTKGELKKRIIENLVILHKGTDLPVFMNLASSTTAVIDEAKKEMLKKDDFGRWYVDLKAFIKWFGSKEVKK